MNEVKNKNENKIENSATLEIPKPEKICQSSCKICQSQNLDLIHELRNNGKDYNIIVDKLKTDFNESVSTSSLSRHFSNYRKQINLMSAKIIDGDMVEKATLQSVHVTKLVKLIDLALKHIERRLANESCNVDISDLDKLMNMRYKLLSGESDADDMTVLFQQASKKYGLQQAILI